MAVKGGKGRKILPEGGLSALVQKTDEEIETGEEATTTDTPKTAVSASEPLQDRRPRRSSSNPHQRRRNPRRSLLLPRRSPRRSHRRNSPMVMATGTGWSW